MDNSTFQLAATHPPEVETQCLLSTVPLRSILERALFINYKGQLVFRLSINACDPVPNRIEHYSFHRVAEPRQKPGRKGAD